ncbi:cytokinesis protein SepA [Edwardsiella tarda]
MGIQGLAEGLLAGFNAADNALNRREAWRRQEAESQRHQANSDRLFTQAKEQMDWNHAYQQRQEAREDKRWAMGQALDRERLALMKADHAEHRAQQMSERRTLQEMPLVKAGYDALQNGQYEQANRIFSQVSTDSPLHPVHYFGQQPVGVAKAIIQDVPKVLAGELDYNSPDAMAILNQVFAADLKRSVGQTDPDSGKKITDSQLIHLGRSEDQQGFIGTLQITYDDGSSAEKPLTRNGSSDPRDTVPIIPVNDLLGGLYNYVRTVGYINQPQQVEFMNRLVNPESAPQEDNRMLRDYQRYAKELDQAESKALFDTADEADRAKIKENYAEQRARLAQRFGYHADDDPSAQALPAALQNWAGSDASKQAFLREGHQRGALPATVTPRQLDAMYADAQSLSQSPQGKARAFAQESDDALDRKAAFLRSDLQHATAPEQRSRIAGELMALERELMRRQGKSDRLEPLIHPQGMALPPSLSTPRQTE